MILEDLLDKYNLKGKAHNVYIFTQVIKGVYVIPQAGRISHDALLNPWNFMDTAPQGNPGTKETRQLANKFHFFS